MRRKFFMLAAAVLAALPPAVAGAGPAGTGADCNLAVH